MNAAQRRVIAMLLADAQRAGATTEEEALSAASVFAAMVLQKRGVSLVPGSQARISDDSGDGTASITFTWTTGGSPVP